MNLFAQRACIVGYTRDSVCAVSGGATLLHRPHTVTPACSLVTPPRKGREANR